MDLYGGLDSIDEVNSLLQERIEDNLADVYDYICSARRKKEIYSKEGNYFYCF